MTVLRRPAAWCCFTVLAWLLSACGQVVTRPTAAPAATATASPTMTPVVVSPTATPDTYTPPPSPTPTATPAPIFYRIQTGDNLFIIADRFDVPHDLLRDVNGITDERALQVGQEIVIPQGDITEPLEPTPTFTPTPLPVAVDHVFFEPSPLGELAILGDVRNLSGVDLERVLIQITLFDDKDRPLGSQMAYMALDALAPQQRAPFAVLFASLPAPYVTYQVGVLSAVPAYVDTLHRELEPRAVEADLEDENLVRVTGRIANVGDAEAAEVLVVITLYDAMGRVVGMRSVTPEPSSVAVGGETNFAAEIVPASPVVTYTIQAQGRRP